MYDSVIRKVSVDSDGKVHYKKIDHKDFYIEVKKGDMVTKNEIDEAIEAVLREIEQVQNYARKAEDLALRLYDELNED